MKKKTTLGDLIKLKPFRNLEAEINELENNKRTFISDKEAWNKKTEVLNEELVDKKKKLDFQISLIADFMHEQGKINQKFIENSQLLMDTCQTLPLDKDEIEKEIRLINNTSLTLKALSELSRTRMDMMEYLFNRDVLISADPKRFNLWALVEKLYKSLNGGAGENKKIFNMEGTSNKFYNTHIILPVAIFIILENAYKYTIPEEVIDINFVEKNDKLSISFTNWGPSIKYNEINKLTEREYRGESAKKKYPNNGKGLGLSIMKDILDICEVKYHIEVGEGQRIYEGIEYKPFIVTLFFKDMKDSKY